VVETVRRNLRAFVGVTAFEDLCCQWVLGQARAGQLPFLPDSIGSHWSSKVQVDVAAINWKTHNILLGECKWGADRRRVRPVAKRNKPWNRSFTSSFPKHHDRIALRTGGVENSMSMKATT